MRTTTTTTSTTTKSQVRSPKAQQNRTFLGDGCPRTRCWYIPTLLWAIFLIFFVLPTARSIIYAWYLVPSYQLLVYCKQQQQAQNIINTKFINAHNCNNNNNNNNNNIPGTQFKSAGNQEFLGGVGPGTRCRYIPALLGAIFSLFFVPCFLLFKDNFLHNNNNNTNNNNNKSTWYQVWKYECVLIRDTRT